MLDELIAKLSPKKKLVLVLFEIEGLPIEEVAKIAECPENTAWSRLHYARAELMAMARKRLKMKGTQGRRGARRGVSNRGWPDGDDPVAAELRRALDEAQQRIPDDVTLRRGWAAIGNRPTSAAAAARGCRGSRAAWPAPRRSRSRARRGCGRASCRRRRAGPGQPGRAGAAATSGDAAAHARRRRRGGAAAHERDAHRGQRRARRGRRGPVQGAAPPPGTPVRRARRELSGHRRRNAFGVAVNGERRVDVDVDEGVVEVWNGDVRLARLEPGQRWNSTPSDEARDAPARPATGEPATAADKATEKPELPTSVPRTRRRRRRSSRRRACGCGPMRATAIRSARTASKQVAMLASPARRAARRRRAARAALAAAMRRARWRFTGRLAQKTGPVGENAAYEIGRHPERARAVRQRRGGLAPLPFGDYPNGILRVEADVSIIETLARAGEADDALAEATDFLRRRPDSERRGEIARLAGDLYRGRGDCRHAVGAYQVALSASRARDVRRGRELLSGRLPGARRRQRRRRRAARLPALLSRRALQESRRPSWSSRPRRKPRTTSGGDALDHPVRV